MLSYPIGLLSDKSLSLYSSHNKKIEILRRRRRNYHFFLNKFQVHHRKQNKTKRNKSIFFKAHWALTETREFERNKTKKILKNSSYF